MPQLPKKTGHSLSDLNELAMQWVLARGKPRFNLDAAADTVADIFIKGIAN